MISQVWNLSMKNRWSASLRKSLLDGILGSLLDQIGNILGGKGALRLHFPPPLVAGSAPEAKYFYESIRNPNPMAVEKSRLGIPRPNHRSHREPTLQTPPASGPRRSPLRAIAAVASRRAPAKAVTAMLQEYFVPYDDHKYLAAQIALHGQSFAVIESDQILLVFQNSYKAVAARCWLAAFEGSQGPVMGTGNSFRLIDDPGLPAAISEMEAGLNLNAIVGHALEVDVNSHADDALAKAITDGFWI